MADHGDSVQVTRWFPATSAAVGEARTWAGQIALATGHAQLVPTVELLVSELATNAVRYADGERFLVEFDANAHVIVAVCDANPAKPQPRSSGATDTGGRGLVIVGSLSERWGAEVRREGKCVWFQLSDPPLPLSVLPGA